MATPAPRRTNDLVQDRFRMAFDHASTAADLTTKLYKNKNRALRISRVHYVNPTGLAADATNFFIVKLLKGSTVIASWSTHTTPTGQGALVANTFVELVFSATDADAVLDDTDELSLFLDLNGTQTLPVGRVVIEGYEE